MTKTPINFEFLTLPFMYFIITFISLAILIVLSKLFFSSEQDKSVYLATSLVGNTGNLGIPLGVALFGVESIPYTSILNIANTFFAYIFSVYFFAKEQFSFKDAIKSIFKIPVVWFAFIALLYNYFEFPIGKNFNLVLEMGSYATIALQLTILGFYFSQIKSKSTSWKLTFHTSFAKQIIMPLVGLLFLLVVNIDPFLSAILLMELIVPLAVSNINFAAIYNCRPFDVASAILVSTLSFILLAYFYFEIIKYFFPIGN